MSGDATGTPFPGFQRRWLNGAAAAALVFLAVAPALIVLIINDHGAPHERTRVYHATVPLPTDVAASDRGVFVASARTSRVSWFQPAVPPTEIAGSPAGAGALRMAVDATSVWTTGAATDTVTRVNYIGGSSSTIPVGSDAVDVAAGSDAVWVSNGARGTITRIDPISERRVGPPIRTGRFPTALAIGAHQYVWVVNSGDGSVARVDPRESLVIGRRVPVGRDPQDIAITGGTVWVANRGDGTVSRIAEDSGRPRPPVVIGGAPSALAVIRNAVLVLDSQRGRVLRIDSRTARVTVAARVSGAPAGLTVDANDDLWVVDPRNNKVTVIGS